MISEFIKLVEIISKSKNILFFTGAGISTSAGIPDFRGSSGIWKTREPVFYHEFISSDEKRKEYWRYKADMWAYFRDAKPTFSHLFIKRLCDLGKIKAVVTQNIDGLHQKSGVGEEFIIELHGNNSKARCLNCSKIVDFEFAVLQFIKNQVPPICECGGYLKPDVVMFGEMLDNYKLNRAFKIASESEIVISVGSSLVVQPACLIPYEAKMNGAFYIIINRGGTAHDEICDIKIDMECDDFFRGIDLEISKNLNL